MSKIIAMWSGPRNLSTAMMRSFGNRTDCVAMDEPFYAACLRETGQDHPMRDEIIAHHETDTDKIVEACLATGAASIIYQKHMMHHMVDGFPLEWVGQVTNVFLIRDPARVLASYSAKWDNLSLRDVGYKEQRALYNRLSGEGPPPPVVDAADIRANPSGVLTKLCEAIDIPFQEAMLSWEPGQRPEDGVWGAHWYDAIWKSTGFAPPDDRPIPTLNPALQTIYDAVIEDYEFMKRQCLRP